MFLKIVIFSGLFFTCTRIGVLEGNSAPAIRSISTKIWSTLETKRLKAGWKFGQPLCGQLSGHRGVMQKSLRPEMANGKNSLAALSQTKMTIRLSPYIISVALNESMALFEMKTR